MLETIIWELTRRCNSRCLHCSNNAGKPIANELNLKEIEELFQDIKSLNIKELRIYGGEPILHPYFFDVIKMAKHHNLPISLYTNATLLNKNNLNIIKNAGINKVYLSLDGSTAKSHDGLRQKPGNFDITLQKIELLKKYGFSVIINFTISQFNKKEIQSTFSLLKEKGIIQIQSNVVMKIGRAKNNWKKLALNLDEIKLAINEIKNIKKRLYGREIPRRACDAGVKTIYISANGEVYPCALLIERKFCAGNIKNKSLKEIITNTKNKFFNEIKTINLNRKFCPTCNLKDSCMGGCRTRAYCTYGSLDAPDPASCFRIHGNIKEANE